MNNKTKLRTVFFLYGFKVKSLIEDKILNEKYPFSLLGANIPQNFII